MTLLLLALPAAAAGETTTVNRTEIVSVAAGGGSGNSTSIGSAISADGRYIAFASSASNLVAGDTNGVRDVFVRDTELGVTTLVSKATGGTIGDNVSNMPAISGDGRYVAFESFATNLDGGAVNRADIFVHDRDTGTTTLVSKATGGAVGLDGSHHPSISADGGRIAFYSYADNFSAVDNNAVPNTFVYDMDSATTLLVSVSTGGVAGDQESVNPAISGNGQVVVFQSLADNLVAGSPDANLTVDIFARNLTTNTTSYVSKATDGTPGMGDSSGDSGNPSVSANGRYVAFSSRADTLAPGNSLFLSDIFVHDINTAVTTLASRHSDGTPGNGPPFGSFNPSISADGRYVAFDTTFTNLSDEDFDGEDEDENPVADIFLHDRQTGNTRYVSRSTAGAAGNDSSYHPKVSADGSHVSFDSAADTMASPDANNQTDIFVHTLIPAPPANVTAPEIVGTGPGPVSVGATLTCDAGTWDDGTITRVWRRNGTTIPGATADTYTLVAADAGASIDCRVTATNSDGTNSVTTAAIEVEAGPDELDIIAPKMSKWKVTRKKFRVGNSRRQGTNVKFLLNERATVRVVVQMKKGKRWRSKGTIRKSDLNAGKRTVRVTGKFGRKKLAPGRYRLVITATDPAGNRSATKRLTVKVIR